MTTENRKVFHAVGMDPVAHEAIKRQAVSRNWNQARYIGALVELHTTAQQLADSDVELHAVLVRLGLERQGL